MGWWHEKIGLKEQRVGTFETVRVESIWNITCVVEINSEVLVKGKVGSVVVA